MEAGHHIPSRITDRQAAEVQNTAQSTVNCDEIVALQIAMYPYSGNPPWRGLHRRMPNRDCLLFIEKIGFDSSRRLQKGGFLKRPASGGVIGATGPARWPG